MKDDLFHINEVVSMDRVKLNYNRYNLGIIQTNHQILVCRAS